MATVAYAALVANNFIVVLMRDFVQPEAHLDNVLVTASLDEFIQPAAPSADLTAEFVRLPGRLGQVDGAGQIAWEWTFFKESYWEEALSDSACFKSAPKAFESFRSYSAVVTDAETVVVFDGTHWFEAGPKGAGRLVTNGSVSCWISGRFSNDDIASFIKYEFTLAAVVLEWLKVFAYIALGHLLLLTVYHRGFVYVLVGPASKESETVDTGHPHSG